MDEQFPNQLFIFKRENDKFELVIRHVIRDIEGFRGFSM